MKASQIIAVVKNSLSGFTVQDKSASKIFAIKAMAKSDAVSTIQGLVALVNNLTAEDQLNGKRSKTVRYAFLSESGAMCSGFSFEVR